MTETLRIAFLGESGVGKTTIINRYTTGVFSQDNTMTCGLNVYTRIKQIEDKRIKLSIWDTAG